MNSIDVYILNNMGLMFVHKFNNYSKTLVCEIQGSIQPKRSDMNLEHIKDERPDPYEAMQY